MRAAPEGEPAVAGRSETCADPPDAGTALGHRNMHSIKIETNKNIIFNRCKKASKNEDQQNNNNTKVPGQPLRCGHANSTWQGHRKAVNSHEHLGAVIVAH